MRNAGVCLIADLRLTCLQKFAPRGILTHRFRPLFPTTLLNRFKVRALFTCARGIAIAPITIEPAKLSPRSCLCRTAQ